MVIQTASIGALHIDTHYLRAKRILDITFTLLIAPLLLTVGLLVALAIRLDSEGPIFFRQKRIGKDGVAFEMLKFRSMYANNDEMVHRAKILQYMQGNKLQDDQTGKMAYKDARDPRITRVGRFIRKASLDELPQFLNVWRGEMSLVGPRPSLPYEVEAYKERDWLRMQGCPGLTGTWQVYGRSRVTFEDMINMDIAYLEKQSIKEDLKLIFLTVPVMITGRGGA